MWRVEQEPFRHLPAAEFRRLLAGLAVAGIDSWEVCAVAGGRPDEVAQARGRVPARTFLAVLNRAKALSRDEHIGLHAAEHTDLNDITAALAVAQPNVGASLRAICRFQYLLFGAEPLTMRRDTTGVRIVMSRGGDPSAIRQMVEYYVRTLTLELQRFGGDVARPLEVRFAHGCVGSASIYEEAFGCNVTFYAHEPFVRLAKEGIDATVATANLSIAAELERLAEVELQVVGPKGLTEQVTTSIQALIASGEPVSCETVASQLALSVRTFQRRLAAENLTFVAVRDAVRARMAVALLNRATPGLSPSAGQLASAVGYSEPSALCRAFKRWTGSAIGAYREHTKPVESPRGTAMNPAGAK